MCKKNGHQSEIFKITLKCYRLSKMNIHRKFILCAPTSTHTHTVCLLYTYEESEPLLHCLSYPQHKMVIPIQRLPIYNKVYRHRRRRRPSPSSSVRYIEIIHSYILLRDTETK